MGRFIKILAQIQENLGKIGCLNGSINQNFGPNQRKFLEKSGDFAQNWAQNWADWYMNGSLFLEKLVFVWDSVVAHPYQNQTWVPTRPGYLLGVHQCNIQKNNYHSSYKKWFRMGCMELRLLYTIFALYWSGRVTEFADPNTQLKTRLGRCSCDESV